MKKYIFITWLATFSLLSVFVIPVRAIFVGSLYHGKVSVSDFSAKTRRKAITKVLQQVLIKVSGNSGVVTLPKIQFGITNAESIVEGYSYQRNDAAQLHNPLFLNVEFNAKAVRNMLCDAGQAFWGRDRPLVLVWLVAPNRDGRDALVGGGNNAVGKALLFNASRRGLPILLPMLDLQDFDNISIADVQQMNLTAIRAAAKRYQAKAILIGNITSVAGDMRGSWSLLFGGDVLTWQVIGNNINQIEAKVVDNVADELAARLAVLSNGASHRQLILLITGVQGLDGYAAAAKYLQGLNVVSKVTLLDVKPDQVKLQLDGISGEQELQRVISLGNKLLPAKSAKSTSGVDLTYRWATM